MSVLNSVCLSFPSHEGEDMSASIPRGDVRIQQSGGHWHQVPLFSGLGASGKAQCLSSSPSPTCTAVSPTSACWPLPDIVFPQKLPAASGVALASVLASRVGRTPSPARLTAVLISLINPGPREPPQLEARAPSQLGSGPDPSDPLVACHF